MHLAQEDRSSIYASLLISTVWLAACAHPPPDDLFGALKGASAPTQSQQAQANPQGAKSCQRDWQCGQGFLCIDGGCVAITPELAECRSGRVHFDFEKDVIHPDEVPGLQRMARCLSADHKMHITIDGNTDERGTLEYNLALGDRRARAVASYLRDLGVSAQQIATITYGKDRPLCEQHDEACWKENRRAGLLASHSSGKTP